MRRSRQLLIAGALMVAVALPSGSVFATTTVSYRLTGTGAASLFPQVSLSGTAKARTGRESGTWSAVFSQDLGAILDGSFTLTSKARSFQGAITGGTFGPAIGDCTRTTIPVHGTMAGGGWFDVTLTRVGSMASGSCVVSSSSVSGTATLVYP